MMCVCVCVCVCAPDGNDLKLGTVTVVDLDTMSQPTDFGFRRSGFGESAPMCISREQASKHFVRVKGVAVRCVSSK